MAKFLRATNKRLKPERKGTVVFEGWYYFEGTTQPRLTKVIFRKKKIVKDVGVYNIFELKSNDGEYSEIKSIFKEKAYHHVNINELHISSIHWVSRKKRKDEIQERISIQKNEIKQREKYVKDLEKQLSQINDYKDDSVKKTALIVVIGWLGDCLFSIPIAEKLKTQKNYMRVDYLIGFPQVKEIMDNNIYIDEVYVYPTPTPYPDHTKLKSVNAYDDVFVLPTNDLSELPTIKFQKHCGIEMTSPQFRSNISTKYQRYYYSGGNARIKIGVASTWKDKNENYRDVDNIINRLQEKFPQIMFLKLGNNISQFEGATPENIKNFYIMLSKMTMCEYVIGAEGGMLNFASSLGTKTICATDFTNALFGENGRLYQYKDWHDRITPRAFFPHEGHINLPPEIDTNEAICDEIEKLLKYNLDFSNKDNTFDEEIEE